VDIDRARDDFAVFARVAGVNPADFQLRSFGLEKFVTAVVASRQLGKSLCLALLGLWWAFREPEQHVLLLAPSEEGSRRLLRTVRDLATASPLLRSSVVDETTGTLTLSNGSVLRALAASERSARGWSANLLLVDEAQLVPDELISAVLPVVSAREGSRVVMVGSASVASGAFYNHCAMGEAGSEHVASYRWVARVAGGEDDAPWLRPEVVAAARDSMSPTRFNAEFMAQFQSGADAAFTRRWCDRFFADYSPSSLASFGPAARAHVGVDWGLSEDRSTAVGIARFAGLPAYGVVYAHRWSAGEPLPDVVSEIASAPGHFDTVIAESVGLGGPCCQLLWRELRKRPLEAGGGAPRPRAILIEDNSDPFGPPTRPRLRAPPPDFVARKVEAYTSSEMKSSMFSATRLLGDQSRLFAPAAAEELRRELMLLRVSLTESGVERIAASAGHDDLAMALALATFPLKGEGGKWRNRLSELAERASRLPEPDLPPGVHGLPTVETASGLAIPRTPAWQSVAGPELTMPAGFDQRRESPVIRDARERVRAAMEAVDQGAN
jgi:hypothetical protein